MCHFVVCAKCELHVSLCIVLLLDVVVGGAWVVQVGVEKFLNFGEAALG